MMSCPNSKDVVLVGEQHETFEETLPSSNEQNSSTINLSPQLDLLANLIEDIHFDFGF